MDEEEQEKVQWLRSAYREVPIDSPAPKRVKVSDIHQQLEQRYTAQCSHHRVAGLIQRAFPNAESKVAGKSRSKHVFGIQAVTDPSEATTSSQGNTSTSTQLSVAQLTGLLESERAETLKLHQKIALLQARVRELERTTPVSLGQQADLLVSKNNTLIACGPDSYEHFQDFSIDGMIHELREQVPDVYAFFMHLGDVERNVSPGEVSSTQELKAVSSLCTLLNARCNRVKGMQLLISMMLLARSTGRQVRALTHININSTYTCIQCYTCMHLHIYTFYK